MGFLIILKLRGTMDRSLVPEIFGEICFLGTMDLSLCPFEGFCLFVLNDLQDPRFLCWGVEVNLIY